MIQGGGFEPGMKQKKVKAPIKNEATNGLKNSRGTLAMARTNEINSATAQFFVNLVDNGFLDHAGPSNYGYAVFGKVTSGMDVIDKIAKVATATRSGHQNVPAADVTITKASRKE
jgi:peptidyl-prolyl cis-trans isomerase B (cyclophilin B)